jgi:hypothetical protein
VAIFGGQQQVVVIPVLFSLKDFHLPLVFHEQVRSGLGTDRVVQRAIIRWRCHQGVALVEQ